MSLIGIMSCTNNLFKKPRINLKNDQMFGNVKEICYFRYDKGILVLFLKRALIFLDISIKIFPNEKL